MSAATVQVGLRAALLLARGRAEGVALVAAGSAAEQDEVARHSFLAMALCFPVFLGLHALGGAKPGLLPLAHDSMGFVLGWLGFVVLSHRLALEMGRAALWPRFVALWNWCTLVQYLLLTATVVPPLLGVPALLSQTIWLAALGWAVWLEWTAVRVGLVLPGGKAALVVVVDIALGVLVMRLVGG
jgi:hypothetical protein